jgi:hypothetical protein
MILKLINVAPIVSVLRVVRRYVAAGCRRSLRRGYTSTFLKSLQSNPRLTQPHRPHLLRLSQFVIRPEGILFGMVFVEISYIAFFIWAEISGSHPVDQVRWLGAAPVSSVHPREPF